ncbi:hypothetical protein MMON44395_15255 [Mycolicibacterium monacense DSM 44395]|nr:hypothetical protein [Mycolicibacterium monacense DSM 44395]
MVQAVVVGADQDEVVEVGGSAVFPVLDVVGVQSAGGFAAGDHAGAVAVFEGAPQAAGDQAGGASGANGLSVAFEPHFAGGVAAQVAPVGIRE